VEPFTIYQFGKCIVVACDEEMIREIYINQSNAYRNEIIGGNYKDVSIISYSNRYVQLNVW